MTNEELFNNGEFERLYIENEAFIYHLAKRFKNLGIDVEEIIGCANLAFTKALRGFNPGQSKWISYFSSCMTCEILMYHRKNKKHMGTMSLEQVLNTDTKGNELTLENVLADEHILEKEVIDKITVREVLILTNDLPPREKEALRLHIIGTRQEDIGKQLELSQAYVSRLIRRIQKQLKQDYYKGV